MLDFLIMSLCNGHGPAVYYSAMVAKSKKNK